METLTKSLVRSRAAVLDPFGILDKPLPEKVLQFGEGGFLRGFADWMIHRMNAAGVFNGRAFVVQPIPQGLADTLKSQDCLYTLLRRGLRDGRPFTASEVISSISGALNPYADFGGFLERAGNPDLRIIISNTTEAGIAYRGGERFSDAPPLSFPGKVTRFLYERYKRFSGDTGKGFIFLPCELIDRNGDKLKTIVFGLAEEWKLGEGFIRWLGDANTFCNTLVDSIMTGYPKEEIARLQEEADCEDALYDTGELFRLWVIEGPDHIKEEFPLHRALGAGTDMHIVWTADMTPYRTRKVRILNGAHTMTVMGAYLAGKNTVGECMADPDIRAWMEGAIRGEIIPVLDLPREELEEFAAGVLERFANPYIQHYLLSIALNSAAKFKARVLPTIKEYCAAFGKAPNALSWAMAAFIAFYRAGEMRGGALVGRRAEGEYLVKDDADVLAFFLGLEGSGPEERVRRVLQNPRLWDEDLTLLSGFGEAVTRFFTAIQEKGPLPAMKMSGENP
ncbi:MAG: tagaturonate reductase [Spirochaetia bacterium]|jgi:tagaturonate reductase|nr:tagaturonate reductase [Spirochaetia bacterium]